MILIVSHFASNLGTTDHFVDYLEKNKIGYYYLRHPFNESTADSSELIYFDGKNKTVLANYKKANNPTLDMVRNFVVSVRVSFRFSQKVNTVIAFGSFNLVPFLLFNSFFKRKLVFWGCDYSTKRFSDPLLNRLYLLLETTACKHSNWVFQPTERQEEARVKNHQLEKSKSVIVPNGIASIVSSPPKSNTGDALLYLGSITVQHGIIDFVNYFYIKNQTPINLYIIGGGELEAELNRLAKKNERVKCLGSLDQKSIRDFVKSNSEHLFGIAPYTLGSTDHVYFGDSLKVKDYLSFGMPFITSKITYVPSDLAKYGYIYDDFRELQRHFKTSQVDLNIDLSRLDVSLEKYLWDRIFDNIWPLLK